MSEWNRKLQKTGPGSLGINLPQSWIRHKDLGTSDELKIVQENGSLQLKPLNRNKLENSEEI